MKLGRLKQHTKHELCCQRGGVDWESRGFTLDGFADDSETILSHLQNIRRALQQGEIENNMNTRTLNYLECAQELSLAIVDMFQKYSSKGFKWDRLVIRDYIIPTCYLCSLLSEAQKLGMFQEINILGDGIDEYLDEAVAVVRQRSFDHHSFSP